MKAHLLYADEDLDWSAKPFETHPDLVRDLDIETVVDAMASNDPYLYEIAANALLIRLTDVDQITYRQHVVSDCLRYPKEIRALYDLVAHATDSKRRLRMRLFGDSPSSVLSRSISLLTDLTDHLEELRRYGATTAGRFESEALRSLFAQVDHDLDDVYVATVKDHLRGLELPNGVFMTAELDDECQGTNYVLRKPASVRRTWRDLLRFGRQPGVFTYRIPERDENGARTLSGIKDRGLSQVADAAAQSVDHVLDFFNVLRGELAFYVGALNLYERLDQSALPVCFPGPRPLGDSALQASDLRDVSLGLRVPTPLVGNDLDADDKSLVMVTGANQGGKSTFLRAVGLAQVMMQAGLFVAARSFTSSVSKTVFTHFRREEDSGMHRGKLDEELQRMSDIVDALETPALLLCNESFACTNEREGSDIASTIVRALQESGTRVCYVTHMFALSNGLARQGCEGDLFLRAQRLADGRRTFKIVEGLPESTSYGRDLYAQVFAR